MRNYSAHIRAIARSAAHRVLSLSRVFATFLNLLPQLVGFDHAKKFVKRVQPSKVVTIAAVEKSALPNVDVKKTKERTKRQALGKGFQTATILDSTVTQLAGTSVQELIDRYARFPV